MSFTVGLSNRFYQFTWLRKNEKYRPPPQKKKQQTNRKCVLDSLKIKRSYFGYGFKIFWIIPRRIEDPQHWKVYKNSDFIFTERSTAQGKKEIENRIIPILKIKKGCGYRKGSGQIGLEGWYSVKIEKTYKISI